ncbi:malate:quinone oxidoreductase [Gordonia shandongensis]|uniref:malate:quinone oxidoreductase n=1 Tax=Gordonia shandongensis TaxID=376351 RepID=UPI0003FD33D7|nr:malate:quinone oxidoreductase [Gordonia shandongensis]
MHTRRIRPRQTVEAEAVSDLGHADVVMIGGGIMSATLASLLSTLEPDWRIVVLEAADSVATESSAAWNNAGTGHSGYCELNYTPDATDPERACEVAEQYLLTRQWWSHLARIGRIDPPSFIDRTPHLSVVFGDDACEWLRTRFTAMRSSPFFRDVEYTEDPATLTRWAPLLMAGRTGDQRIAATRHRDGTDVDFGELTRQLLRGSHAETRTGVRVVGIRRRRRDVAITAKRGSRRVRITAGHVFIGAGGHTLRLLQRARIPEIRRYGVLPVGAAFLRCSSPSVVAAHDVKIYGRADVGAPPMSVPHLDRRRIDGADHLMFGPYALATTRLLLGGRRSDFFTTLRPSNLWTVASAVATNLPVVRYLIGQLVSSPRRRFALLSRYVPSAISDDWQMRAAGLRAQLVAPERRTAGALRSVGVIRQGTETVVSDDRLVSGLLGASPGASTAVPIMIDLLQRAFPERWGAGWDTDLAVLIPGPGRASWTVDAVSTVVTSTAETLGLQHGEPDTDRDSEQ